MTCCLTFISRGLSAESALPSLQQHGDTYLAACTPSELRRLRGDVVREAGSRNPQNAWQVVHVMLCLDDKSARRFITRHMAKTIVLTSYSLGEVESKRVSASTDFLLRKEAWGGSVEESAGVSVNYQKNAACSGTFFVKYNGQAWLITRINESCD